MGAVALVHLKAYRDVTGIEVVGVSDTSAERRRFAEQELSLPAYSTVGELIRTEAPELCCVLTPPAAHEAATVECANAGVHVLCEKPMALTVAACKAMIDACRRNDVRLCYGASYRYLPAIQKARAMILEGQLGEVRLLVESAIGGHGPDSARNFGSTHYPAGGPGGSPMGLCDHGIHLIDAFGWMTGSHVTEVWGRGNISGQALRPEWASLRFASGAIGQLLYDESTFSTDLPHEGMFSWGSGWGVDGAVRPPENEAGFAHWNLHPGCIHVFGTRGSLRLFHYANALFHTDPTGTRQIELPNRPVPANFSAQMQAFVDAIRGGEPSPVPGEVGLAACQALLGIYRASGVSVS